MELRRYVIKFAFDGNAFEGYARQPSRHTVEDELIEALKRARIIETAQKASFASASRVDKGVCAISAAAAFDTHVKQGRILDSINAIASVDIDFDPRREAESRWYRYHFKEEGLEMGLDVPNMRAAAELFLGEHDFSAFARPEGRNPRRRITRLSVERKGGALILDIHGESFLWNQVRRMATTIKMVGEGEVDVAELI